MKIIIYDNCRNDVELLRKYIEEYRCLSDADIESVQICQSAEELFGCISKVDLLFLDIELSGESGLDVGKWIKMINPRCKVIITSAFQDYLIAGYKINACRYFLKPIERNEFFVEMDSIMEDYFINQQGFYDESIQRGKIYYHQILFIEAYNRKTEITLENGKVYIVDLSLTSWIEKLKRLPFGQSYKSILVNFKFIQKIDDKDIYLVNRMKVPISRHFKKDFCKKFKEYLRYGEDF